MKKTAVIVAAGRGVRMNSELPKQFIEINGKSILHLTIEKFLSACPDANIIVVLAKEYIRYWKDYCYKHSFFNTQIIVPGGISRFHSVQNALARVDYGGKVLIHDGVRPLASVELIRRMFDVLDSYPAAVPVVPSVDTLVALRKSKGETKSLELIPGMTVNRDLIFSVQTPQAFRADVIKKAYSLPFDVSFTDDASVLRADGVEVEYVMGERYNLKLTTPQDLVIAKALLATK